MNVISGLPENINVGLVTYGRNVKVYELASRINTNYCINGTKEYTLTAIMDLIGIQAKNDPQSQSSEITKRFIAPLNIYRNQIISRIKSLKPENKIYLN